MINNKNGSCVRKKLNSWLIGLIGLVVIVAFFLIFRIGQRSRKNAVQGIAGANAAANNIVANNNSAGSYHQIVDIIRPAVVGISLPGAQPFLQGLGGGANLPELTVGQAGILTMNCPNCGTSVTRQQGTPWQSITCPNCGASMVSPLAQPKAFGVV